MPSAKQMGPPSATMGPPWEPLGWGCVCVGGVRVADHVHVKLVHHAERALALFPQRTHECAAAHVPSQMSACATQGSSPAWTMGGSRGSLSAAAVGDNANLCARYRICDCIGAYQFSNDRCPPESWFAEEMRASGGSCSIGPLKAECRRTTAAVPGGHR